MKRLFKVAAVVTLALSGAAGAVSATEPLLALEPHIMYHYNQEVEPRQLVAVSGLNCDGSSFHEPLIMGQYTEYFPLSC